VVLGAAGAQTPTPPTAEPALLSNVFSDHAVFQRDRANPVWGKAAAGAKVSVAFAGASLTATADGAGHWRVELPALPAGGPHTLTVSSGDRSQTLADVLLGDVWLCSGQSNMQFSVRGALDSRAEAATSTNDRIRSLTIERTIATTPLAEFPTAPKWSIAGPETTPNFSAVCYFFVRELQKSVNVPQAIITSAWGGSKIEPWMSEAGVSAGGASNAALGVFREYQKDPVAAAKHWGEHYAKWWLANPASGGTRPWAVKDDGATWRDTPAELTPWEGWGVPELERFNGIVWYRKHVTLTAAQAKQAATLSLAQVDEVDLSFVNGVAVGSSSGGDRKYAIPPKLLKAGDNLIVVNALDTYASGGMYGGNAPREIRFADGTSVALSGAWQYSVASKQMENPPRAPWESTAGLTTIYNAMIAPLGAYGLKGAVWYQGESNSSLPESRLYQKLLASLMADWRRQFNAPLPFLVVQLANYGATTTVPVESGWAGTREAMRRAVVADGNAALAVTVDIGNPDDVHPTNKQEVGRRLARAARHLVFKENISASGAEPLAANLVRTARGPGVLLKLGNYDGKLVVRSAKDPSGFEVCGEAQRSCRFVSASILEEGHVALLGDEVSTPARVRYCWADSPICNLYDSTGLPVGPFEIPVGPPPANQ
jgi:sialate O-acetylesterase